LNVNISEDILKQNASYLSRTCFKEDFYAIASQYSGYRCW